MEASNSLGPCLHWGGSRTDCGYGVTYINQRQVYAHRLAYCDSQGVSIDSIQDKVVRHKCDTPSCFNPSHLEIGTQADNMRDMYERGRRVAYSAPGERNPFAKLTDQNVIEIKRLYVRGSKEFGLSNLAKRFGVSTTSVHKIINGQSWSHVSAEAGNGA